MIRVRFASLAVGVLLVSLAGTASGEDAKTPRTDMYGDPLPSGAVMRLGTVRLRHANAVVAFSKDGKHLISCDNGGTVRVWDATTGKQLRQNRLLWTGEKVVVLSPDGATAAVWEESTLSICDTNTAKKRGRIPSSLVLPQRDLLLTFSPDGKYLTVQTPAQGQGVCTQIWEAATLKKRQTLTNPPAITLVSAAFSGDGKRLAAIACKSDGSGKRRGVLFGLLLWDVVTGKLLCQREDVRQLAPVSLAFSPDGKTLAVAGNAALLLDAATLKRKTRLKAPAPIAPASYSSLLFSPDGRWLAAGYDEASSIQDGEAGILLWNLDGSKQVRHLAAPTSAVALAFSPDSKTLACRLASREEVGRAEIRLYDTASGRPMNQRPGHDRPVVALTASPDCKTIASGDADGAVRLWDAATSKQLRMLQGRPFDITSCLFSLDGKRVVAAGTRHSTAFQTFEQYVTFQVWDAATGKALQRIEMKERGDSLYAAAISADGKRLAAVVAGENYPALRLIVWDVATGKRLSQRPYKFEVRLPAKDQCNNPPETIVHASFAPDGERMTVWLGDRVGLVEVATGCLLAKLPRHASAPLIFSPDGRLLAAARREPHEGPRDVSDLLGVSLIETASGQEVLHLKMGEGLPESGLFDRLAFTSDGRHLFATDWKQLTAWDTDTGTKLYQRDQPKGMAMLYGISGSPYVSPLVLLPGGRMAAGMAEGDILIWDMTAATRSVHKPASKQDKINLDALWFDLAADARTAHRAIWQMTAAPARTLPFLKEHLRPVLVDTKRIEKLLADLDGNSFAAREAAVRELTRLHYRVEPMLRKALEGKPSLEVRWRIESILAGPKKPLAEDLRTLRAIQVLERIGTPEARRIGEKLRGGCSTRGRSSR